MESINSNFCLKPGLSKFKLCVTYAFAQLTYAKVHQT